MPCQLIRSRQLNDPIPIKPEATLGDRIRAHTSDLSQLADKLDSSDEVSDIFPSHVPKKHLHIIVQLPPTGECGSSLLCMNSIDSDVSLNASRHILSPRRSRVVHPIFTITNTPLSCRHPSSRRRRNSRPFTPLAVFSRAAPRWSLTLRLS